MAKTFAEMAEEVMAQVPGISAEEARQRLGEDSNVVLVDVRDVDEVQATGLASGGLNISLGALAFKADLEVDEQYREPRLQDHSRQIITTCAAQPCYRGATAAKLLITMGFTKVSYVEGGMEALMAAGITTE